MPMSFYTYPSYYNDDSQEAKFFVRINISILRKMGPFGLNGQ